ncbi:MAG: AAA family ATPase [Opitutaceae bacterium]
MILHAIELTHVGPFRDTVRVGPFARGFTLLEAPNESGKSTAIRAAARALFDRHTTKSEEIKSLQPAGTDLAPRVAVEFETREGRFRIEKTFLLSPRSLLQRWHEGRWQAVAEADAADRRTQELLESTLPGRGATQPEHWGFLGFLWARQGEPTDWPSLDDPAVGQRIRARLAKVEIDPVIEALRQKLAAQADGLLTSTGHPKTGGALRHAEDDLVSIDRDLATLRQSRAELDLAHQRFTRGQDAVQTLEREAAEHEKTARALGEQALAVERLRGELDTRRLELAAARESLAAVVTALEAVESRTRELAAARLAHGEAAGTMQTQEAQLVRVRGEIDAQLLARPAQEARVAALRAHRQRLQDLLKLRELHQQTVDLQRQHATVEKTAEEVTRLEAALAKLPTLTPARLRALEELAEALRTLEAQTLALGLTADLVPDSPRRVTVNDAGEPLAHPLPEGKATRIQRPQVLDLQLEGWGRIVVRSGAREAQTVSADLAATRTRFQQALREAEVVSLDDARAAVAQRKELDLQVRAVRTALTKDLGSHASAAALLDAIARAHRRAEALASQLQPTPEETARGRTELESAEAQAAEALPAAERTLQATDAALQQLRQTERGQSDAVQQATRTAADLSTRLRTLESQVADLHARFPEGLAAAKAREQQRFAEAEARQLAVAARLPPDHERLPERNRRATAALQQVQNALQASRTERDSAAGKLESLGGLGLYSQESLLEERRAEAGLRRDALRGQAWTARLAHDLIEHRKQAATRSVLAPLEERLTEAFADLTGVRSRRVFLRDDLQIQGIGGTRDTTHGFDVLSQGAKEQLLLCLRLAVARELAASEPQVLILDDVLVNTDAGRQRRVLDVLADQAAHLQIVLLTCHAERYRGLGETLRLGSA